MSATKDGSGTFTGPNPTVTGQEQQQELEGQPDLERPQVDGIEQLNRAEANLQQFPSLHGQPNVEVAARSADVEARSSGKHRKVFVVWTGGFDFDPAEFDHGANFNATRQYMLDNGLRPTGDVHFAGAEDVDGNNTALTYEVDAIPAVIAVDPAAANVVVAQN